MSTPHDDTSASDAPHARRTPRRRGLLVAAVVALLLVPVAVVAADRFRDVPSDATFHDEIGALAEAGITLGCAEDRYCPSDEVGRAEMAGFLQRGLGTVAFDASTADLTAADGGGLGGVPVTVTLDTAGEPRNGAGLVVLDGAVTVYTDADLDGTCPCEVEAMVHHEGGEASGPSMWTQLPAGAASTGTTSVALPVHWTTSIDAGASEAFSVSVFVNGAQPQDVRAEASLSATYVPFGEAG